MAITSSAIDNLVTNGGAMLTASETTLDAALLNLGPSATAQQLVAIQGELAKNSMITATISGCIKERGDCLKGAAQHIG